MKTLPTAHAPLVIRTDFSDASRWDEAVAALTATNEDGFMADVQIVDDPAFRDLPADRLRESLPEGYDMGLFGVVDATALASAETPVLVVDLGDEPGRTLRVIATEYWGIENNVSLGNMDFAEFAESVDPDGVFRGF
ncbi:DUF6924 domain-containing protein [Spirillospora sp. CA-294931]|uniref:DUF6924 domain-containing protein n=1 Tax=Spirillospora sp. CA-294931 TaxID=3240042 RepID=UPI003D8A2196